MALNALLCVKEMQDLLPTECVEWRLSAHDREAYIKEALLREWCTDENNEAQEKCKDKIRSALEAILSICCEDKNAFFDGKKEMFSIINTQLLRSISVPDNSLFSDLLSHKRGNGYTDVYLQNNKTKRTFEDWMNELEQYIKEYQEQLTTKLNEINSLLEELSKCLTVNIIQEMHATIQKYTCKAQQSFAANMLRNLIHSFDVEQNTTAIPFVIQAKLNENTHNLHLVPEPAFIETKLMEFVRTKLLQPLQTKDNVVLHEIITCDYAKFMTCEELNDIYKMSGLTTITLLEEELNRKISNYRATLEKMRSNMENKVLQLLSPIHTEEAIEQHLHCAKYYMYNYLFSNGNNSSINTCNEYNVYAMTNFVISEVRNAVIATLFKQLADVRKTNEADRGSTKESNIKERPCNMLINALNANCLHGYKQTSMPASAANGSKESVIENLRQCLAQKRNTTAMYNNWVTNNSSCCVSSKYDKGLNPERHIALLIKEQERERNTLLNTLRKERQDAMCSQMQLLKQDSENSGMNINNKESISTKHAYTMCQHESEPWSISEQVEHEQQVFTIKHLSPSDPSASAPCHAVCNGDNNNKSKNDNNVGVKHHTHAPYEKSKCAMQSDKNDVENCDVWYSHNVKQYNNEHVNTNSEQHIIKEVELNAEEERSNVDNANAKGSSKANNKLENDNFAKECQNYELHTNKTTQYKQMCEEDREEELLSFEQNEAAVCAETSEIKEKYPFMHEEPLPGVYLVDLNLEKNMRFCAVVNRLLLKRSSTGIRVFKNNNNNGASSRARLDSNMNTKAEEADMIAIAREAAEEMRERAFVAHNSMPYLTLRVNGVLLSCITAQLEEDSRFRALQSLRSQIVNGNSSSNNNIKVNKAVINCTSTNIMPALSNAARRRLEHVEKCLRERAEQLAECIEGVSKAVAQHSMCVLQRAYEEWEERREINLLAENARSAAATNVQNVNVAQNALPWWPATDNQKQKSNTPTTRLQQSAPEHNINENNFAYRAHAQTSAATMQRIVDTANNSSDNLPNDKCVQTNLTSPERSYLLQTRQNEQFEKKAEIVSDNAEDKRDDTTNTAAALSLTPSLLQTKKTATLLEEQHCRSSLDKKSDKDSSIHAKLPNGNNAVKQPQWQQSNKPHVQIDANPQAPNEDEDRNDDNSEGIRTPTLSSCERACEEMGLLLTPKTQEVEEQLEKILHEEQHNTEPPPQPPLLSLGKTYTTHAANEHHNSVAAKTNVENNASSNSTNHKMMHYLQTSPHVHQTSFSPSPTNMERPPLHINERKREVEINVNATRAPMLSSSVASRPVVTAAAALSHLENENTNNDNEWINNLELKPQRQLSMRPHSQPTKMFDIDRHDRKETFDSASCGTSVAQIQSTCFASDNVHHNDVNVANNNKNKNKNNNHDVSHENANANTSKTGKASSVAMNDDTKVNNSNSGVGNHVYDYKNKELYAETLLPSTQRTRHWDLHSSTKNKLERHNSEAKHKDKEEVQNDGKGKSNALKYENIKETWSNADSSKTTRSTRPSLPLANAHVGTAHNSSESTSSFFASSMPFKIAPYKSQFTFTNKPQYDTEMTSSHEFAPIRRLCTSQRSKNNKSNNENTTQLAQTPTGREKKHAATLFTSIDERLTKSEELIRPVSPYALMLKQQAEENARLISMNPLNSKFEFLRRHSPSRAFNSPSVQSLSNSPSDRLSLHSWLTSPRRDERADKVHNNSVSMESMTPRRRRPLITNANTLSLHDIYTQACGELGMRSNSGLLRTFPVTPGVYLDKLDLSVNYVGARGFQPILCVLEANKDFLTLLNLSNNNLENNEILELLDVLSKGAGRKLHTLDLSYNPISQTGGQALLTFCETNTTLIIIKVSGTLIPPKLLQSIEARVQTNIQVQSPLSTNSNSDRESYGFLPKTKHM